MDAEERQRTMDFILQQQAKFDAGINELRENYAKADVRLTRLENILRGAIRTGLRERREWREKYAALVDAQIKTEDAARGQTDRMTELQAVVRRNSENIKSLEEATRRNSENIKSLEEATRRTSDAAQRASDAAQRASDAAQRASEAAERSIETSQRNSEDISRLAKIVERSTARRNGDDAARDSDKGE